jgi:hypothetical protein
MKSTMTRAGLVLAVGLAMGMAAHADEWDVGIDPDNGGATDNVLFHGSEQIHDLRALGPGQPDEDWYLLENRPYSSYQVVIAGQTGALDLATDDVQRLDAGGGLLQNAFVSHFGGNLTLNWFMAAAPVPLPLAQYIRVRGALCGATCSDQDRYRVRFYDTTYTIPRFNNSGTQTTVLMIQNTTDRTCRVDPAFFGSSGNFITFSSSALLAPRALHVLPTAGVAGLEGQSGSVRILHECGHGGLSGKAVSVEPSTGFTFDTAMTPRPY